MKFKDEYVLARGWPDCFLYGTEIGMVPREGHAVGDCGERLILKYPTILNRPDCPKYELVLRRVIARKK